MVDMPTVTQILDIIIFLPWTHIMGVSGSWAGAGQGNRQGQTGKSEIFINLIYHNLSPLIRFSGVFGYGEVSI